MGTNFVLQALRQLGVKLLKFVTLWRAFPMGTDFVLQALRQPGVNLKSLYHIGFKKAKLSS